MALSLRLGWWLRELQIARLRRDKGESGAVVKIGLVVERTADRSASLGMTKGRVALSLRLGWWLRELQIARLRSG